MQLSGTSKQVVDRNKQSMGWITRLVLLSCAFLLLLSELLTPKISSQANINFLPSIDHPSIKR